MAETVEAVEAAESPLQALQQCAREELDEPVREVANDLGEGELPQIGIANRLDQGDLSLMWAQYCSKRKLAFTEFTSSLAIAVNSRLPRGNGFVQRTRPAGPYLNLILNRALVYRTCIASIRRVGPSYGQRSTMRGKRAVVEHTSSNPNAPLHIGNLRNTMIGAHLAKLFRAVGYDVDEVFYVNDLGAQIGLTALSYSRCYDCIKPTLKIDKWIGMMYATMNTCSELQTMGVPLDRLESACKAGDAECSKFIRALLGEEDNGRTSETDAAAGSKGCISTDVDITKLRDQLDTYLDLRGRFPHLISGVVPKVAHLNIKDEAAKLNLAYERQEDWAIRIFRKMVTDCLTGVQETLNTYNIQHDRFDFESELGWEGSNQKVMSIMQSSAYYNPPQQCNDKGKPEGGFLDMSLFIEDQGFKIGKGGFQKDFPKFYILRPDGSTLYTFRDVVYSFKKVSKGDIVCNVISSEQDLAQQKVALSLFMMNPKLYNRQVHLSYELVKLTEGKMSGRRGWYVTADELYTELRKAVSDTINERKATKGEKVSEEYFENVVHEVASAAMKYALLSVSCGTVINFDVRKVTSFDDSSAPFVLYNRTRLKSLEDKFEERVQEGLVGPLPNIDDIDFTYLDDQREWEIFLQYVLGLPELVQEAACPTWPTPPQLPDFGTHKVCEYLDNMVRAISSWYGPSGVRVLPSTMSDSRGGEMGTHARMYLLGAFKQCLDNALRLIMVEPLDKM
jgi:arginyl-tRNA synthetase